MNTRSDITKLNRETYNKIAEDWHRDHQSDTWWIDGTDVFVSLLPRQGEILDVGCGGGFKSSYLIQKGLRVTGVDISENLIAIAKHEVPAAKFLIADMHDLSALRKQFDGVFAQASLLHIPRKEARSVISSLEKRLKNGGYIYIAVKGSRKGWVDEKVVEENDLGYPYKRFFSYFSMEELRGYMGNFGMEIVYENVSLVGKTNWLQIIGRKL